MRSLALVRYLSKFKWRHLTGASRCCCLHLVSISLYLWFAEKLAYDREVQRQREQAELMQGKKERDAYVAAVHKVRRFRSSTAR